MTAKPDDVYATVTFSQSGHALRQWPIAVIMMGLGLVLFVTYDREANPGWKLFLLSSGLFLLGAAILGHGYRLSRNPGPPDVELSPDGILYRTNLATPTLIPWSEVSAVESVSFTPMTVTNLGGRNRSVETIPNMTVAIISNRFYAEAIDPGLSKRSVFWGESFARDGDRVQVAFNHLRYGQTAEEVYKALNVRRLAFGQPKS